MNIVMETGSVNAKYHRIGSNIIYSELDGANNYYIYNGQGNVTKILDSSYEISAE